jgi:hypothetical protein
MKRTIDSMASVDRSDEYLDISKSWRNPVVGTPEPCELPALVPSCKENDLVLFLHIDWQPSKTSTCDTYISTDDPCPTAPSIASVVIKDEQLAEFLEHGRVHVPLSEPIVLGKALWNFEQRDVDNFGAYHYGLPVKLECPDGWDWKEVGVRLHCVRTSDCSIRTLLQTKVRQTTDFGKFNTGGIHPLIQEGQAISQACPFDFAKPHHFSHMSFSSNDEYTAGERQVPKLRDSHLALQIQSRLNQLLYFDILGYTNIIPNEVSTTSARIVMESVSIQACNNDYNEHCHHGSNFGPTNGVSLLCLFSELEGSSV